MKLVILICTFFLSISAKSQNLTKEQLKQDLDSFRIKLPINHKNLFAKITPKEFEEKINKVEKKLPNLSKEEFEVELAKIIKQVGDEHTMVIPKIINIFPIDIDFFKEGIYYTSKNSNNFEYEKIKSIGNKDISEVIEKFKTVIPNENEYYFKTIFLSFVKFPDYLNGLKINNNLSEIKLNEELTIQSIPRNNYIPIKNTNLLRFSKSDNYWFKYMEDKNILYINYSKCNEIKEYPFSQFTYDIFKIIENKDVKTIVIDLRENGGGNSAIIKPFLNKLKDSNLNDKEKLFVLIGRKTFSSALMNAITLKKDFNSTLIGEPTSGNINHYGEVRGIELPNTKTIIQYSTKYWENWKGKIGPLKPDVNIEYSFENYKNNIDEALEYIYKSK